MAAEEPVTNYFSYVKNVLGVKTLQSARLRQSLQALDATSEAGAVEACDLLFLNLKQKSEPSVFTSENTELLDKMIQAMRLGERRYLILECELSGNSLATSQILKEYSQKVKTPFAVVFTSKPQNHQIQNLGTLQFLESFGPAYLLQNPQFKKMAWMDLQKVMKELGVS